MPNDEVFLPLLLAMIVAGLFSGVTRHLSKSRKDESWVASIFMSTLACMAVPLFLQTISSQLIEPSAGQATLTTKQYLVFFGTCLIAGYFAPNFISRLYQQLIRRTEEVEKKVEEATETAQKARDIAEISVPPEVFEPQEPLGTVEPGGNEPVIEHNPNGTKDK